LPYVLSSADTMAIRTKGPSALVARSTKKLSSLVELSVQLRSIWSGDSANATRFVGAAGASTAESWLERIAEKPEKPSALNARTL